MPWCEDCERFANPNSLGEDGSCPTCGRVIADEPDAEAPDGPVPDELRPAGMGVSTGQGVPWHFWILLVAVVGYLGWRLVEGIIWLVGQF